jgi:hypothetical protein
VHSAPSIPPIAETGRSFTIIFTSEEEKNVLTRMIHMHMISDKQTKELNPSHVQLLNTMFANKKKRLDCFNDRANERQESIMRRAAGNVTTEVFVASDNERASLDQPELGTLNSIAWSDLGESVKRRRLAAATKEMRENFLPFLRKCIDALDEDGAPLGDDFLMSEFLRYGVRDANKRNRISPTLSMPGMLPNFVVDLISDLAREEREAEEKREMRVEALTDWLEIYQKGGAAVFRLLRSILPDRMIPSLYQIDHFKETLALEYGPTISWRRTYSGFQIKAAEFLPVYILSNLMRYVSGYDTGLLDDLRLVFKCLVDGFHLNQLNCVHALAFHMNLILLPLDTALAMTDLYPTDTEARARNPAGQRGISCATMALALGQETWANLRANFVQHDPTVEHNPRKIQESVKAGGFAVDKLKQICDLFGITKNGKKAQGTKAELSESILAYFEANESLFDTELFAPLEEEAPHTGPGERDSKTDLMRRVPPDQMMLPFMDSIRGARFTARIPVGNRSQNKADVLSIKDSSDGKAVFRTVTGRLDSSYNVDMKCLKASFGFGTGPCQPNCISRCFVSDLTAGSSGSTHAGMPKRRRHCDKQPPAQCGKVCPACDVRAHNHYRYLSFLSLEEIKVQIHWKGGSAPLTLGIVADFYKMTADQVIRYSCAAFLPEDLRTAYDAGPSSPAGCNCQWLQKGMFGYSGQDVTSPRNDKVLEDPNSFRCSASNPAHENQRLLNYVCVWETVANVPTLGLWGAASEFSADTNLDSLTPKALREFPESQIGIIVAVRHLWVEEINAPRPLHDSLLDPRLHVCGQLHGPFLGLTRWLVSTIIKISDSKNMLGVFNKQHSQVLSVSKDEKNQLPEQNFHGPKARKIVTWYASFISWDPITDIYIINDNAKWPLRGIVDGGPNLQHVLASFFHLNKEQDLAWSLFLTRENLFELFSTTLEVSIRFRALTIYGFAGFPLYVHYHLHGPFQIWLSNFQGYRAAAEDVGEAQHCEVKALAKHTVGGAMGRGWLKVSPDSDDSGVMLQRGVSILENKSQRIVSGDSNVLYQIARSEQLNTIREHMPALEWQKRFEAENPGLKAFEIDLSDMQACGLPPRPAVISAKMITPYDVIDRIGAQGRLLPAAAADEQAGGRSRMMTLDGDSPPSPPHSPRKEHSDPGGSGPGSNNPALRKKQRPLEDEAAVTVEQADSQPSQHFQLETVAAGMQASVPGKRGGRTANAGRKAGPRSRALFGGA